MPDLGLASAVPLWLKISYTAFVAITIPVYVRAYGPGNFLWFSDIALLVTVAALWSESAFLASMMAVGVLLPELAWNLSFFGRLLTGKDMTGLAAYMFDASTPPYLRGISLFHVFLPVLLVWLVSRLGYAPRAWLAQTALAWIVLPLSYWLTDPQQNVNRVYGLTSEPQQAIPPIVYLAALMAVFPVLVYFPTRLVLRALFR